MILTPMHTRCFTMNFKLKTIIFQYDTFINHKIFVCNLRLILIPSGYLRGTARQGFIDLVFHRQNKTSINLFDLSRQNSAQLLFGKFLGDINYFALKLLHLFIFIFNFLIGANNYIQCVMCPSVSLTAPPTQTNMKQNSYPIKLIQIENY